GRQVGLQPAPGLDEPGPRRGTPFLRLLVPEGAALQHLRAERLALRLGGEVVLRDPALTDQDRVRSAHRLPSSVSGTTTSSGRTSCRSGAIACTNARSCSTLVRRCRTSLRWISAPASASQRSSRRDHSSTRRATSRSASLKTVSRCFSA